MFVKPKPGVKVRHETAPHPHVPEEGAEVPDTSYYRRRVMDGDLIEQAPPAANAIALIPEYHGDRR